MKTQSQPEEITYRTAKKDLWAAYKKLLDQTKLSSSSKTNSQPVKAIIKTKANWADQVVEIVKNLSEAIKENQEEFEGSLPLNMGQILSIPFIIVGIIFIVNKKIKKSEA